MSIFTSFKKSRPDPDAVFLCESMASENDRVIQNQIQSWAGVEYGVAIPNFLGFHPASLAMARLMGCGSVIAAAKRHNRNNIDALIEYSLSNYSSWSKNGYTIEVPPELAESLLDGYIGLVTESYSNQESALTMLTHSWLSAILTSWGDTSYAVSPQLVRIADNQL